MIYYSLVPRAEDSISSSSSSIRIFFIDRRWLMRENFISNRLHDSCPWMPLFLILKCASDSILVDLDDWNAMADVACGRFHFGIRRFRLGISAPTSQCSSQLLGLYSEYVASKENEKLMSIVAIVRAISKSNEWSRMDIHTTGCR